MKNNPIEMFKSARTLSQIAEALSALPEELPRGWLGAYNEALSRIGAVDMGELYYWAAMRNEDGSVAYITHNDGMRFYVADCDIYDAPLKVREALGV